MFILLHKYGAEGRHTPFRVNVDQILMYRQQSVDTSKVFINGLWSGESPGSMGTDSVEVMESAVDIDQLVLAATGQRVKGIMSHNVTSDLSWIASERKRLAKAS